MVRSCLPVVSVTTSPGDGEASTYSRPSAPCRTARRPGPMGVRIRCLAKRSTSSGSCASAAAQPETSKPIAVRTFSWEAILVRMPPVDYYGRPGGCRTCLGAGAPARRRRGGAGLRTTSVGSCRRPPQAHHRALRGRASLPRRFALSAALPLGTARLGQGRMGAFGWPPPALLPAHPDRRQNPRRAALALARFLGSRQSHRGGPPCLIGSGSSVKSWEPCRSATGAARKSSRNWPSNSRLPTKRRSGRAWTSRKRSARVWPNAKTGKSFAAKFSSPSKVRVFRYGCKTVFSLPAAGPKEDLRAVRAAERAIALNPELTWISAKVSHAGYGIPGYDPHPWIERLKARGIRRTALDPICRYTG